jgi:hypothetical protein
MLERPFYAILYLRKRLDRAAAANYRPFSLPSIAASIKLAV